MSLGAGYVDFAGSGVVHAVGGVAGARRRDRARPPHRQVRRRTARPGRMPGHHIPMAMLGTFILLFGWFGFNAASTFAATDVQFAVVAANTAIAGAFGAIAAMFWITKRTGKPDPGMMANGMLAGLVAITAPCAFVAPVGGGRHRRHRRRARHRVGVLRRAQAEASTTRSAPSRCTASAAPSACSPSASSPTAATAPAGTARSTATASRRVEGILYGGDVRPARRPGASVSLVIWTVIFGVAFAFFKIQDALTKGGIRSDGGGRDRRPRPPGDGCPRLPRLPGFGVVGWRQLPDLGLEPQGLIRASVGN